jgi:hypothetical protein
MLPRQEFELWNAFASRDTNAQILRGSLIPDPITALATSDPHGYCREIERMLQDELVKAVRSRTHPDLPAP